MTWVLVIICTSHLCLSVFCTHHLSRCVLLYASHESWCSFARVTCILVFFYTRHVSLGVLLHASHEPWCFLHTSLKYWCFWRVTWALVLTCTRHLSLGVHLHTVLFSRGICILVLCFKRHFRLDGFICTPWPTHYRRMFDRPHNSTSGTCSCSALFSEPAVKQSSYYVK